MFMTCPSNPCLKMTDGVQSLKQTGIGRKFLLSKRGPEIKVARHCTGHVDLRYIVWESSLVMEGRAVIIFLTLKKLSTRDITAELEGVSGHEALFRR
jgi:hypothetical protein